MEQQEINVLLLGESGVGKSTFINSCFNYLKYKFLSDLLSHDLFVQIPAKINIEDINYEHKMVQVGINTDQNEVLEDGKAATQDVKAYVFPLEIGGKKYIIRLLDTPGMGDARGTQRDEINCERILSYISQLKEIHGFCLLLKPNKSRLDAFFNYCILQILSRLESSAVKNVIFIFTNTRGGNFTPGQTFAPLKELVNKIKNQNGLEIPMDRQNVFCFDNEAFRYAAAVKNGVEFDDFVREATESSWNHSVIEFWRLLLYVTHLEPHDLKKTLSINDAKSMASNLIRPATEIMQLINDNLTNFNRTIKELEQAKMSKEELVNKMNTTQLDIRIKPLEYPQTVCCHENCMDTRYVNGIRKVHYKNICCYGCIATFVTPEVIGNVSLYVCSTFSWLAQCKKCHHQLNFHKHVYYTTEMYEKPYRDMSFVTNINSQADLVKLKETFLHELEEKQHEFEQEKLYILESCAVFDEYLKNNSIANIGRPVHDYLQTEIARGNSTFSEDRLNQLKQLQAEYEVAAAVANNKTSTDIYARVNGLMNLKHFGGSISELYQIQKSRMRRVEENREIEVPIHQANWFRQIQDIVTLGGAVPVMLKMFKKLI